MRKFLIVKLFLVASAVSATSLAAYADTITQDFSLSESLTGSLPGVYGFHLAQFNPALGTLTSITGTITGLATFPVKGGTDVFQLGVLDAELVDAGANSLQPTITIRFLETVTASTDAQFNRNVGLGTTPLSLVVTPPNGDTAADITTFNASGTITYTYTPAVSVSTTPEPSSLMLLGTGVLGLAGAARRRLAGKS